MKDHVLHDAVAALSLANLSLLGVWDVLLNTSKAQGFFLPHAAPPSQYAAAMANVLLLGLVCFAVIRIARIADGRYGVLASAPILLLIALPAAKALVRIMATYFPKLGLMGAVLLITLLLALIVLYGGTKTFATALAVLVTLSPLIATEAVLSIARCRAYRPETFANGPLAPLIPPAVRPRIVWIIFDELDYRLTFPDRPKNLAMPAFDRLRAESISASDATSPADFTLYSVSSLLTGRKLRKIFPQGPSQAMADGDPLTTRTTVFSTIHAMGGNVAIDGWYLPYCRLFAGDLAQCSWHDLDNSLTDTSGTFTESVALQQQSLFEFGYMSFFRQSLRARHRVGVIQAMREESRRYAADRSFDFVYIHLPAPHPPHYYDRVTGTFTKRNAGAESYPDSLALADLMLGEIRESMTSAGLWNTSTVLVSSDHRNRNSMTFDGKADPRVPFLLKLAETTSGIDYSAPVHTLVTKSLLEAIFDCRIESPEQAVKWLQANP